MKTFSEYLVEMKNSNDIRNDIYKALYASAPKKWFTEKRSNGFTRHADYLYYKVRVINGESGNTYVEIQDDDGGHHAEFTVGDNMTAQNVVDKIYQIFNGE